MDTGRRRARLAMGLILPLSGVAFGACQSDRAPAEPLGEASSDIRKGTQDGAGNDKSIFLVLTQDGEGTAFNILYPRCMLTAAHGEPGRIHAGVNLVNLAGSPQQDVAIEVDHPSAQSPRRDLSVLWMKALASEKNKPRIQEADYTKIELKDSIGLQSADLTAEAKLDKKSAGGPIDVKLFGYGDDDTNAQNQDIGGGIRRWGEVEAQYFIQGSAQTVLPKFVGGYYHMLAKAGAAARASCSGDSGGPVMHDGKAFAVISDSEPVACNAVTWTRATSLDKGALPNKGSNWDFVHETAEKHCAKKMLASHGCDGKVTGTIAPAQKINLGPDLNGAIKVGDDGCPVEQDPGELVHHGQTITLVATPHAGYKFVRWEGTHCPCECETSPTCVAPYDEIGHYTTTESIDQSMCTAVFDEIDPNVPPPGVCCEGTGLCRVCIDVEPSGTCGEGGGDATSGSSGVGAGGGSGGVGGAGSGGGGTGAFGGTGAGPGGVGGGIGGAGADETSGSGAAGTGGAGGATGAGGSGLGGGGKAGGPISTPFPD